MRGEINVNVIILLCNNSNKTIFLNQSIMHFHKKPQKKQKNVYPSKLQSPCIFPFFFQMPVDLPWNQWVLPRVSSEFCVILRIWAKALSLGTRKSSVILLQNFLLLFFLVTGPNNLREWNTLGLNFTLLRFFLAHIFTRLKHLASSVLFSEEPVNVAVFTSMLSVVLFSRFTAWAVMVWGIFIKYFSCYIHCYKCFDIVSYLKPIF